MDTRVLECIENIQPPPVAVTQLIAILGTEYHADDVLDILKSDPALTGSVLKKCNTVYFAQRTGATSMKQAIQLLGSSTIMNMILELTVSQTLDRELTFYAIPRSGLRQHSFFAGMAAQKLTDRCGILPFTSDTAFTAGLLHDIGKIAINEALSSDDFSPNDLNREAGQDGLAYERSLLGTDHAEVGAVILEKWNFPDYFYQGVAEHHQPSIRNKLAHLIHLANWCAHSANDSFGLASTSDQYALESMGTLALEPSDLERSIDQAQKQIEKYFPDAKVLEASS